MSAKHTPGPWVILPPVPFEGDDENEAGGFAYPGGIEGSNGDPVCMFGDPSGSGTMFENAANARLIAAAPDLLDVLKDIVCAFAMNNAEPAELRAALVFHIEKASALAKALSPAEGGK